MLEDDEHPPSGMRCVMRERAWSRWFAAALTLAAPGCGPSKNSGGGSASGEGSIGSTTEGMTAVTAAALGQDTAGSSSDADSGSSTGPAADCPDNVANEPLCYRKFAIEWDRALQDGGFDIVWYGPPSARVGNFGPSGEEAFLLAHKDAGTPMSLAFWNGAGFDVEPWGVVPVLDDVLGRIPLRLFDGVHSDLVVGAGGIDPVLAVAPWTPDGPGEPVVVEPETPTGIVALFRQQPILDVDDDGREESAVYVSSVPGPGSDYQLFGSVDGVPAFFGPRISPLGACGGTPIGMAVGQLDDDGFTDLAEIGSCDVRDVDGAFSFVAQWGDGTGVFEPVEVPFTGRSPTGWLGVADFDGDGRDDVVVALDDGSGPAYEAYVEVHRSRGDRTFDPPVEVWNDDDPPTRYLPGSFGTPLNPAFVLGDVDGDGAADLVFRYSMVAVVQVLGERQPLEMFDIGWAPNETEVISAFDFNHDGRSDFVVQDLDEGVYALISS
ncbi:MAG: VCBS repeat-containing protein [Nannocystaceae bacterium]|nr:VCBS repeat-containing protein [Nannocystaceae bacterium]